MASKRARRNPSIRRQSVSRNDVIRRVATRTGYSRRVVREILNAAFLDVIPDALLSGFNVRIDGFGTFRIFCSPGNPRCYVAALDKYVEVPPRGRVSFRPIADLKLKFRDVVLPESTYTGFDDEDETEND